MARLSDRPYTDISGGERQLIIIARVLAQDPKVIILDEPLSHLDLNGQANLFSIIRKLISDRKIIVSVMHDPSIALSMGDDFLLLKNGKMLSRAANPHSQETLESLYEVPCHIFRLEKRTHVFVK